MLAFLPEMHQNWLVGTKSIQALNNQRQKNLGKTSVFAVAVANLKETSVSATKQNQPTENLNKTSVSANQLGEQMGTNLKTDSREGTYRNLYSLNKACEELFAEGFIVSVERYDGVDQMWEYWLTAKKPEPTQPNPSDRRFTTQVKAQNWANECNRDNADVFYVVGNEIVKNDKGLLEMLWFVEDLFTLPQYKA